MDYENYLNQIGGDDAEDNELRNNIEEAQREEFLARENKVKDWYMQNLIPYWRAPRHWLSFWELDNDILIKAVQNDIRVLLKDLWESFSWEITIKYNWWRPIAMESKFESSNDEEMFRKIQEFVGKFWFVGHKRYGDCKNIYWEKLYRYTDDSWVAKDDEWVYTPKKTLKGKNKNIS